MWGFTKIQQRAILFLLASFGAGCVILFYRRQQPLPAAAPDLAAPLQNFVRQFNPDTVKMEALQPASAARTPAAKSAAPKRVDINAATLAELMTLPGIGATMAQRLVDYREQQGKFRRLEDLLKVKGIGKRKLAAMKEWVILE